MSDKVWPDRLQAQVDEIERQRVRMCELAVEDQHEAATPGTAKRKVKSARDMLRNIIARNEVKIKAAEREQASPAPAAQPRKVPDGSHCEELEVGDYVHVMDRTRDMECMREGEIMEVLRDWRGDVSHVAKIRVKYRHSGETLLHEVKHATILPSAGLQRRIHGPLSAEAPVAEPVGLKSAVTQTSVDDDTLQKLERMAAETIHARLVTSAPNMVMQAMCGNPPDAEVLFNTKIARAYSRVAPEARAAPQNQQRTCTGCWDGISCRGAYCTHGGKDCSGCDYCVGQPYVCGECNEPFELRWAYGSGSGASSVAPDPMQVEVHRFTDELESAIQQVDGGQLKTTGNTAVMVAYAGRAMCALCAGGVQLDEHGSHICHTTLGQHQDNSAGGANSQGSDTANVTLNVGAPRQLTMELHLCERCDDPALESYTFDMERGTEFRLAPEDEKMETRQTTEGCGSMLIRD
tara:strand:- start:296 stop:1684 length:1389 start_codon:yes stop_codon:yes gene_type:complete